MKNEEIKVNGIYRLGTLGGDAHVRFYKCVAVCLGGTKQEDIIEFESLDRTPNGDIRVSRFMVLNLLNLELLSK